GDSDIDATSHRVLAAAMSTLQDRSVLDGDDIRNALPGNDLASQIERVRVTPLPQSVEELSKLWTAFQTNYRTSAVYEVAVVLIDSQAAVRAPLPVLRRLTLGAGHLHRGPADAVAGAAGAAEQRAAAGAGADHHREPAERAGRRPHAAAHLHAAHPRRPARAAVVR